MAKLQVIFGDISIAQAKTKDLLMKKMLQNLPPKLKMICDWYKQEVASFKHVYYNGYEDVQKKLGPIILGEEPKINLLVDQDKLRIHIELFDDSVGGSLDRQTPTGFVHGEAKKNVQYPQIGWWRFFEMGEFGQPLDKIETAKRSWGSDNYGFVKTGENTGFMAPLGSFVKLKSGKRVLVVKKHPGVLTMGFFEKTWLDLKEDFVNRIYNAVKESLSQ
jgi:hypothetical protein